MPILFLEAVLRTRYQHTRLEGLVGQIWISVCVRKPKRLMFKTRETNRTDG